MQVMPDTVVKDETAALQSKTWTNVAGLKPPKALRQQYRPLDYRCDHRAELSALSDRQRAETSRGAVRSMSRPVSRSDQQHLSISSRPVSRDEFSGHLPSDRLPRLERADLSATDPAPPLLRADFVAPKDHNAKSLSRPVTHHGGRPTALSQPVTARPETRDGALPAASHPFDATAGRGATGRGDTARMPEGGRGEGAQPNGSASPRRSHSPEEWRVPWAEEGRADGSAAEGRAGAEARAEAVDGRRQHSARLRKPLPSNRSEAEALAWRLSRSLEKVTAA